MKKNTVFGRLRRVLLIGFSLVVAVLFIGCVRVSKGTWYFRSAATPADWPEITPIDTIEVKTYPTYRAATVTDVDVSGEGMEGMDSMFMTLFQHIKKNEIAMTAPVDMGFQGDADAPRIASMAFLYRDTDLGTAGQDGQVRVEDLAPLTFASVGVRGDYTLKNYQRGLRQVEQWLNENEAWEPSGTPRYLGYNSPFVPTFWRYGEVQVPVTETSESAGG